MSSEILDSNRRVTRASKRTVTKELPKLNQAPSKHSNLNESKKSPKKRRTKLDMEEPKTENSDQELSGSEDEPKTTKGNAKGSRGNSARSRGNSVRGTASNRARRGNASGNITKNPGKGSKGNSNSTRGSGNSAKRGRGSGRAGKKPAKSFHYWGVSPPSAEQLAAMGAKDGCTYALTTKGMWGARNRRYMAASKKTREAEIAVANLYDSD